MNKRQKKKQWTMWSKRYAKRWKKDYQRARAHGRHKHPVIQMLECERIQEKIEELFAMRIVRKWYPSIKYTKEVK